MAAAAWIDAARLLPGVDVDRCLCPAPAVCCLLATLNPEP